MSTWISAVPLERAGLCGGWPGRDCYRVNNLLEIADRGEGKWGHGGPVVVVASLLESQMGSPPVEMEESMVGPLEHSVRQEESATGIECS